MMKLIIYLFVGAFMNGEIVIFDFNKNQDSSNWKKINDVVMGGISKSTFNINENGTAIFEGKLSPENNGGFASVRTELENENVAEFEGVIIKARGDGNTYNIRFRTNYDYDGIAYQAKFKTTEEWKEFKIPLDEFIPTFRGRKFYDQPKLESKNIKQIGIMISDKQFGNFQVQLDWIKFYK